MREREQPGAQINYLTEYLLIRKQFIRFISLQIGCIVRHYLCGGIQTKHL